jgi:triosephosphate isomerase
MPRIPLLAGNWKMYKTPAQTKEFFSVFSPLVAGSSREVVICPPFVDIPAAVEAARNTAIEIGGQTLYWQAEGAFTGEISGPMLHAAGARWVIIGHSERRQHFGETDPTVLERTKAAISAGLKPIVCVGESLGQREAGQTEDVLRTQFNGGLAPLTKDEFAKIVVAYEPVWAIGTGVVATPEMAQAAHAFLRELLPIDVRILYGGSVKPDNVSGLMKQPDIDGALVGGASLEPKSFAAIVNFE